MFLTLGPTQALDESKFQEELLNLNKLNKLCINGAILNHFLLKCPSFLQEIRGVGRILSPVEKNFELGNNVNQLCMVRTILYTLHKMFSGRESQRKSSSSGYTRSLGNLKNILVDGSNKVF